MTIYQLPTTHLSFVQGSTCGGSCEELPFVLFLYYSGRCGIFQSNELVGQIPARHFKYMMLHDIQTKHSNSIAWVESMACHCVFQIKRVRLTPCSNKKGLSFQARARGSWDWNVHLYPNCMCMASSTKLYYNDLQCVCLIDSSLLFLRLEHTIVWLRSREELLPSCKYSTKKACLNQCPTNKQNHVEARGRPKGA